MLKKIFISKVRISILDVFLSNLDSSHHVRELVRILDEEINAVRRELMNLESAGLLKCRKEGNKSVYRINKESPYIWELRSIFFKESPTGQAILDVTKKTEGIELIILTDSFIKKKYQNPTDVDFLFIGTMRIKDLSTIISQLEKELGKEIRFSAITKEDFEFARKKKEPFLMNILENDKIILFGQLSDLL